MLFHLSTNKSLKKFESLFQHKKKQIVRAYHHRSHNNKLLLYLAFIIVSAVFVLKINYVTSQTIFPAPHNQPGSVTRDYKKVGVRNGTFHHHFLSSWGEDRVRVLNDGELFTLSLDKMSGSGFESRRTFMFARIDMQIKLIPGNSAGTVTTYYLSSEGNRHDEIDIEFFGNSTGSPYTLHTNVFCQGKGNKEQQFTLWFDPTKDFHTYSILWNPRNIIFFVDNVPIRQHRNMNHVPFPKDQPMKIYSSVWNGEDWATQGGQVKTDWSAVPFVSSFRNFSVDGCIWSNRYKTSSCTIEDFETKGMLNMELDRRNRLRMKKFQGDRMVYNYCQDRRRFPKGPARECRYN